MINRKLILLIASLIAAIPILACGGVGVYDPEATQSAMSGTVTALQATISALENKIDQDQSARSTSPIQAATETPTVEATPTSTVRETVIAASSLEQTVELAPTPTPLTVSPQDRTVILVATLTPTPTPESYPAAPVITEPREGVIVEEGRELLLRWSWNGILRSDEYYDLKIRPDGQDRSAYVAWERGEAHDLQANLAPGRYYWTVQIIKGYYKNNSGEPEDRVFEAFLSPESKPRLLIVAAKEKDEERTPTPTPTERPDLSPDNPTEATPEATDTPTSDDSDSSDEGDNNQDTGGPVEEEPTPNSDESQDTTPPEEG
jgi:hypothetical protein